jgi:hypothetical protein
MQSKNIAETIVNNILHLLPTDLLVTFLYLTTIIQRQSIQAALPIKPKIASFWLPVSNWANSNPQPIVNR